MKRLVDGLGIDVYNELIALFNQSQLLPTRSNCLRRQLSCLLQQQQQQRHPKQHINTAAASSKQQRDSQQQQQQHQQQLLLLQCHNSRPPSNLPTATAATAATAATVAAAAMATSSNLMNLGCWARLETTAVGFCPPFLLKYSSTASGIGSHSSSSWFAAAAAVSPPSCCCSSVSSNSCKSLRNDSANVA